MAQFIDKIDYFGLADSTMLVCKSSDDGKTADLAEVNGQDGSIIEGFTYAERLSPSNEYTMVADWTKQDKDIALGDVKKIGETTRSICLNSISISTSAGSVPTISASGEEVELNATASCKYEIDEFTVSKKHHAQVLWDAFKLMEDEIEGVEGVHLNSASYSLTCGIGKATKDGVCLSHDVVQGKIECSVEFVQTLKDRSPENALTPGEGWTITSPMKCSNKDADFPTWTATLTKYLVKAN